MFKSLIPIKLFYTSEFYRIYNKISRNKSLSLFLILISQSQIYYLICHPFSKLFQIYAKPLFLFNKFFQNINLDFQFDNTEIWSELFLILMLALQLLYFLCFIHLYYSQRIKVRNQLLRKQFSSLQQRDSENESNSAINLIQVSEIYISFGTRIYKQLFHYPIIQLAFRQIFTLSNQNSDLNSYQILVLIITYLVFSLNILFYILNETHNIQYSFKKVDYLSRFYSFGTLLQSFTIETMIIVVSILDNLGMDEMVTLMIQITLLTLILILSYKNPQYQEELVNKIQIQSFSLYLSIILCILIFAEGLHQDFSELIMIILPFVFEISKLTLRKQENKTQNLSYENKNFDCLMMNIYNQCQETLGRNGILLNESKQELPKNLNLYSFSTNHLINCENVIDCFCCCYKKQDDRFTSRSIIQTICKGINKIPLRIKIIEFKQKQFVTICQKLLLLYPIHIKR
ncbi:unnamed protein product (macronuclear) [Paramecium tetraurelia]|uniref:Transmembrane protein n=1 Tax=Paramecium tetraurelia TaxID=5888 RepID=A0CYX4_PARTE|nr:uncharacterized protein GSPATT00011592001 [Paramecium tetraurelia]CAK75991.1 unnamed protein product [Paramecium tetraurelia]|eukprot:XP_001443388.1 hypothetical protein (macronuclear) [Paramecium tetraurelia strain d4-2]